MSVRSGSQREFPRSPERGPIEGLGERNDAEGIQTISALT